MSLYKEIARLVEYGLRTELVAQADKRYMINQLLEVFHEDEYEEQDVAGEDIVLPEVLDALTDIAFERGIISSDDIVTRDLFDTKLMGILTPRPSQVIAEFEDLYGEIRRRRQMHFINSARIPTISAETGSKRISAGRWTARTERLTSRSTCPNRKKTRKPLRQPKTHRRAPIRNVSSAWRTRDMPEE